MRPPAARDSGSPRASLAAALRSELEEADVILGEQHVSSVAGTIDRQGGAVATVADLDEGTRRVQLMPSLPDDALLLAACACARAGEPGCEHVWAVLRAIDASGCWPTGVALPAELEMTDPRDPDLELIAEEGGIPFGGGRARRPPAIPTAPRAREPGRRAPAAALDAPAPAALARPPGPAWRELLWAWPRASRPAVGRPAAVEYVLQATAAAGPAARAPGWLELVDDRACAVVVSTISGTKRGELGRRYVAVDAARLSEEDLAIRTLLFGVEEIAADVMHHGSPPILRSAHGRRLAARIATPRVSEILGRLAATGRFGWLPDPAGALAPLAWDAGGPWSLEIEIAPGRRRRQAAVTGRLVRGDERLEPGELVALAGGGVAIVAARAPGAPAGEGAARAIEVAVDGLGRWLRLLGHGVSMPVSEVPAFVARSCDARRPPRLVLGEVGIELADEPPACRVVIEPEGRAGFRARAELAYGGEPVELEAPAIVVRARGKRIVRRRLDDEHAAALAVRALGGSLEREWRVPPAELRALVEAAAARGLEVFYGGGRLRAGGAFEVSVTSGIDWFDLSIAADAAGAALELPELLAALRTGRPLVRLSDGTVAVIPAWLERRAAALAAAPVEGGALRFRRAEALLLAALVDGAPALEVDATFARLRDRLDRCHELAPRDAPRGFGAVLRDYQREGLGWLCLLRELGLGGCLADDMGLGKTVQVLALLEHLRAAGARRRRRGARKPSLVVAPRSLVFHWLDEARRFAPKLATLEWHGLGRAARAAELAGADLIVTTYATLRLDLDRLAAIDYDVVILDEAHAIKTAATATARAARALRAEHRLALTGTPVENRLEDLASIFDFLNPGLLGRPAVLRAIGHASAGAEDDGDDAGDDAARRLELAHARALGRVLRPFLLRRTKQQVLTELPAKTEIVVTCRLEGAERRRYDELRDHYRRLLRPAIEGGENGGDGIGGAAIVVLEALLRLRQAALHPGLLDARRAAADSAKLDALIEHLREAIASGHRALVFSQFTTLLGIASERLRREGIGHEYLDGDTRDRRARVEAFQAGSAPVFLISLKAGGVGLNLTAADHVFLLDPWWNPAVEAQAIDRVHRIGQGRPVTAYRLVAEDTVEAKILALQAHKRALFASVFEDAGFVASLSAAELRALLE